MAKTTETIKKYTLPCIAMRDMVAFPEVPITLDVARQITKRACDAAMKNDGMIFLVCQKDPSLEAPSSESDFYSTGVVANIRQLIKGAPNGTYSVIAEPKARAELLSFSKDKYITCEVMEKNVYLEDNGGLRAEALMRDIKGQVNNLMKLLPRFSRELWLLVSSIKSPSLLCDFISANLVENVEDKQSLLSEYDPMRRMELLLLILEHERAVLAEEDGINRKVKERIDRSQREYFLREQLKVIHEELGEGGDDDEDIEEYYKKLDSGRYPKEVADRLKKEIRKLQRTPVGSADGAVLRGHIETCLDIPFGIKTRDRTDIPAVEKILNADHDGLGKVKERILEYLAALKLNPELKNQIICLVGPPGTGKTSIASSIARAMNRKFVRVSLGGIRDESDIRGHRKTYVGSMPGRIITGLINAKSSNPLMLLDEIDKMASDSRGDPASAMLEVLDGEQNKNFRDHFVEMPVDLSDCLFIATANSMDGIPLPLIDRMEIIELRAYTRDEKLAIARHHLIPKQAKRHGLNGRNFKVDDAALGMMIDEYTREAGVRSLERKIARCARKAAKTVSLGEAKSVHVTAANLADFIGTQKMPREKISDCDEVGVVNGMAYTETGGDLLKVEVLSFDGTGKTETTGSLGDVMRESAHAAISYIRSRAGELGIDKNFYKNKDIHIHVPEGAVPKDGPSAGVTMATALASELTGIPVRRDIAMTGEITLHGRVLAIGGLREKTMAAYLAGVKTILIPKENETDMEEIAPIVKENVKIIPVSHADEVLALALVRDPFAQEEAAEEGHAKNGAETEIIPINPVHNSEMSCSVR